MDSTEEFLASLQSEAAFDSLGTFTLDEARVRSLLGLQLEAPYEGILALLRVAVLCGVQNAELVVRDILSLSNTDREYRLTFTLPDSERVERVVECLRNGDRGQGAFEQNFLATAEALAASSFDFDLTVKGKLGGFQQRKVGQQTGCVILKGSASRTVVLRVAKPNSRDLTPDRELLERLQFCPIRMLQGINTRSTMYVPQLSASFDGERDGPERLLGRMIRLVQPEHQDALLIPLPFADQFLSINDGPPVPCYLAGKPESFLLQIVGDALSPPGPVPGNSLDYLTLYQTKGTGWMSFFRSEPMGFGRSQFKGLQTDPRGIKLAQIVSLQRYQTRSQLIFYRDGLGLRPIRNVDLGGKGVSVAMLAPPELKLDLTGMSVVQNEVFDGLLQHVRRDLAGLVVALRPLLQKDPYNAKYLLPKLPNI